MNEQEKTVRELISDKRGIQERLREAETVEAKAQAQHDLDELDAVLKPKVESRFWQAQSRDWKTGE